MENFELISFTTDDELAQTVASAWLDEIESAKRAGELHCAALSGGRITQKFYGETVRQARTRAITFERVHFFWADERCVPPDDRESNYRLASELLFKPLKIAGAQIHRIHGEDSPENAAGRAEAEIHQIVPVNSNNQPVLGLILLGMGEDGHTASLFPSETEAFVSDPAVYRAITNSPKPPPNRVTLGYPAIAAAQKVWVLVSGAGKSDALKASLSASGKTPLARVLKCRSNTRIFTDIRLP